MGLRDLLDARTGYRAFLRRALDEPVRGGARWSYVFGSGLAFLFLLQVATGVLLGAFYSASSREAWGSVHFISHEVAMGWFVRGLHHWSASAMVALLMVHLFQVLLFGAYRAPREVTWWTGILLLAVTLAFSLTGYLLPWDQKGYWATRVVASIAGTFPVGGDRLKSMLQGGNDFGTLTLTRFYAIHVFVLPATLVLLLSVHVFLFRRHGVTPRFGREEAEIERGTEPFWPRQLTYDAAFSALLLAIVAGLTIRHRGAPLEAPADPSSNYPARPEWYFLWLFQLLTILPGRWETAISFGATIGGLLLLAAVPLLDRRGPRSLRARFPVVLTASAILTALVALTVWPMLRDVRDPALRAQKLEAERAARRAFALAKLGIPPGGTEELYLNDPIEHGRRLFEAQCASCHKFRGLGGDSAPDLSGYATKPWLRGLIANPRAPAYYGATKLAGMTAPEATPAEIDLLTDYVLSLGGNATAPPAAADLFDEKGCHACHALAGEEPRRGPSLDGFGSRAWIRAVILDPGAPRFFGESNQMPKFEGRLSEAELDDVLTYLLSEGANAP